MYMAETYLVLKGKNGLKDREFHVDGIMGRKQRRWFGKRDIPPPPILPGFGMLSVLCSSFLTDVEFCVLLFHRPGLAGQTAGMAWPHPPFASFPHLFCLAQAYLGSEGSRVNITLLHYFYYLCGEADPTPSVYSLSVEK